MKSTFVCSTHAGSKEVVSFSQVQEASAVPSTDNLKI